MPVTSMSYRADHSPTTLGAPATFARLTVGRG